MRLPGRIPRGARLGTVLAGRVEGSLGRAEPVGRGVVGLLGVLTGGVSLLQRGLRGGQPAAQLGQLPDRLAPLPRPVHHTTIIASCKTCGHPRASCSAPGLLVAVMVNGAPRSWPPGAPGAGGGVDL